MMNDVILYLRMSLRRRAAALLILLFAAAVTVFLLLYPQLIQRTESEMEYAYDSVSVSGWVLNANGYDDPEIPPSLWKNILNTGLLEAHHSCASFKVSVPGKAVLTSMFPTYAPDSQEVTRAYADWVMKQFEKAGYRFNDPNSRFLMGVSSYESHNTLLQQRGNIRWAEGYDESFFLGDEQGAVVSAALGFSIGDTISVAAFNGIYQGFQLKVVGVISGGYTSYVYCPVKTLESISRLSYFMEDFLLSKMTFTLQDNRRLEEFKDALRTVGYDSKELHISIDDRALRNTVGPIQSNLDLLQGLYVIFFLAVALIGFFLCFLLARRRKQEFAVMRLLGETGMQITGKALLEQAMLCVIGIMLGVTAVLVSGLGGFSALTCGGVLLCYSIGSALAVMLMVRVNVMEILRDKE